MLRLSLSKSYFLVSLIFFLNLALAQAQEVPKNLSQIQLSFAPLVKVASPAVVNVYAARKMSIRSPFDDDPFFKFFFSQDSLSSRPKFQSALGSGVIIDKLGIVVTNYHVIRDADEIKIGLSDGQEFSSSILFKDEKTDIALLKLNSKKTNLPTLPLADSDNVEVGDLVLAIGNPFGVGQTVTSGIVSAQARTHVGISDLDFFIQTDAAINPGNSGGALINMQGQLIGINTAIYSRSGGSVGIGFAIPANLVRAIAQSVKEGNKNFNPPYLGATFQAVNTEIADSLGMDHVYGVLITEVIKNSPADKAGLKVGDVLFSIDGKIINDPGSLAYRLLTKDIKRPINISYFRKGQVFESSLKLQKIPENKLEKVKKITGNNPFSGATIAESSSLNQYFPQKNLRKTGVIIKDIDPRSIASRFFEKNDQILEINNISVKTIQDLENILAKNKSKAWSFKYERQGAVIQQFIR